MNPEDELPTDEDELIEFVQNLIKKISDNPDFTDPPVPIEELQKQLDKMLKAKRTRDVAKEEEQAAWERFRLEQQHLREQARAHGMTESQINMIFSGKIKIANRMFSQLPNQGDILSITTQKTRH